MCVCDGAPKQVARSQTRFLTALLPLCVRIAVCFGTQADRDALAVVHESLASNLVVSAPVPCSRGLYEHVEDALLAWWDHCGTCKWVNEKPMTVANPEHTATVLYILCSLHKLLEIDVQTMGRELRELRLDGNKVVFPTTYEGEPMSTVVDRCKLDPLNSGRMDATILPSEKNKVVRAVFMHALKCLKVVPTVTDWCLVRALHAVRAYAEGLPASA